MKLFTQMKNMILEKISSPPGFSVNDIGRIIFDTTEGVVKVNNGTEYAPVGGASGDKTLINVQINGITLFRDVNRCYPFSASPTIDVLGEWTTGTAEGTSTTNACYFSPSVAGLYRFMWRFNWAISGFVPFQLQIGHTRNTFPLTTNIIDLASVIDTQHQTIIWDYEFSSTDDVYFWILPSTDAASGTDVGGVSASQMTITRLD